MLLLLFRAVVSNSENNENVEIENYTKSDYWNQSKLTLINNMFKNAYKLRRKVSITQLLEQIDKCLISNS